MSELKEVVAAILAKTLDKKQEEIAKLLETPQNQEVGDYAFPCFVLAKELKKSPQQIAEQLMEKIKLNKEIEKVEVRGAYLNFFVNKKILALNILEKILKEKARYGRAKIDEKIMIEFSAPNTHKAFHVGHIRGTSLGESLARLAEFQGNKVIRANYSGDTGMHIAKWIWCYKNYHDQEEITADEEWIASIYVDAVKRLEENPDLQNDVDVVNRMLESRSDKDMNKLWEKTRQLSIDSWKKIYKQLNTHFDIHFFESQVEADAKNIANNLVKKKIAKISEEATIIDLEKYNLSVWVLLRKDGTVLYSAKDIVLALKKMEKYPCDKYLITIGDEQKLHFQQLVKTLELMGVKGYEKYGFLTFGMIRLPTGKMSSRTGQNILYSEFMEDVQEYATEQIEKRFPNLTDKELEKRALAISIASIKYAMLKQNPDRVIIFSRDQALDFEGNTGPYLLYSYARASSIIKKSEKKQKTDVNSVDENESGLIKVLGNFPSIVQQAHMQQNPSLLANYAYDLAQTFNEFYHTSKVVGDDKEAFRLALVESFRIVLKQALNLLGIDVIEEM